MVIYEKNINDIVLEDITNLIAEKFVENKFLEYKGYSIKRERDKILKAVCGFANADGGLLIYGLEEEMGEPQELTGISLEGKSWDDKKLQIQDWIKSGIEPRLSVEMKSYEINNDKIIILIKVPKSWNPPHCVKNKNQRTFYIRRDGLTDSAEYDELRRMFNLNNSLVEKINDFRNKRVAKFESDHQEAYSILFHAVPITAFTNPQIDIEKAKKELETSRIIGGYYKPNFEGLYYPNGNFFKQFYRNGIYEMHYTQANQNEEIPLRYFEEEYLKFAHEIFDFYQKIDIICPIVFFVSLTNVQGHNLTTNGLPRFNKVFDKKRSVLNPNGMIIENETQIESNVNNLFVPLWNHFGISKEYKA